MTEPLSAAKAAAHLTEPPFVAETLAWCNERRAEKGEDPLQRLPLGKKGVPESCPCGRATGLSVWSDRSFSHDGELGFDTPPAVAMFVKAFDRGDLPQYDVAPEPDSPSSGALPPSVSVSEENA